MSGHWPVFSGVAFDDMNIANTTVADIGEDRLAEEYAVLEKMAMVREGNGSSPQRLDQVWELRRERLCAGRMILSYSSLTRC